MGYGERYGRIGMRVRVIYGWGVLLRGAWGAYETDPLAHRVSQSVLADYAA